MNESQEPARGEPRIIKRYANRKLYDTHESRYVTLHEVAEFVRGRQDVQIVDNRTKEDLTNVTLAQIIYEEEKAGDSDARRGSLLTFIQEGRERLITSLPKFPFRKEEAPIDEALALRAQADERVRGLIVEALGEAETMRAEVSRLGTRVVELEARLQALLDPAVAQRGKSAKVVE